MINYYLLTKPGIIFGNLVTLAAGFMLATKGSFSLQLFLITLIGLAFVIASACVFNNYIDRNIDSKMERTRHRPSVTGKITPLKGILFATILLLIGLTILALFTNFLALTLALFGFFIYVLLYSFWKCHTTHATFIGSFAGAVPPVMGYVTVSNTIDLGAFLLFGIMLFWQMPHFFSIAMYRLEEYTAAKIPVLPVVKGVRRAKIHMVIYILVFALFSASLTFVHYTGTKFLLISCIFSALWLILSLLGFREKNEKKWGKQMFILSLIIIMTTSLMISLDRV